MPIGTKRSDILVVDPATAARATAEVDLKRNMSPSELASDKVKQERKEFLGDSLRETRAPEEIERIYERVLGGNDLMPIAYLERGAIAARAVARIDLGGGAYGTGFLIAPRVLITNYHVIGDKTTAAHATANFQYEVNLKDVAAQEVTVELVPDELFHTSPVEEFDFTVVAVSPKVPLWQFGCLPLIETTGKTSEGEWLTIIQHPSGQRKQVCVRENKFIKRTESMLWYTTDTEPGSSGSPVFNNDWFVVALHHAGVPETRDGIVMRQSDGSEKWIANEGVRVSRIVQNLRSALPTHPLLTPMYDLPAAKARISEPPNMAPLTLPAATPSQQTPSREAPMADGRIVSVPLEVKLQIGPDGNVTPLAVGARGATESFSGDSVVFVEAKKKKPPAADAPFDDRYEKRKGYNPAFLGNGAKRVGFPKLGKALQAEAAALIDEPKNFLLHYNNYSVVMHKKRRMAIYSAANVSFGHRFEMGRPPDVWRRDPRILAEHQLESFYYAHNKFDRGHLTRREDLEFGTTPIVALQSAADTCHWTNCTPQHSQFNQNKEIWQGIERYVLEESIRHGDFDAQIITGPILDEGDPEYRKIQYPLRFWKVVAAINSKKELFATAYMASQEEVIAQFGIEVTEVPFGAYKTFQTKISEIERLTGLTFECGAGDFLRNHDPLEKAGPKLKKKKPKATESTGGFDIPANYVPIDDFDDIVM